MNEYLWFVTGGTLIVVALISWLMDVSEEKGVKVMARVKKVVTRDNYNGGYLTYLERDQTYAFSYEGKNVEKEEKMSGLLYEEGEEAELIYNPKKDTITHPGEKSFNPFTIITMCLVGAVLIYGGFVYETNQPSIALLLAAVTVFFAGTQVYAQRNAMKKSQEVSCLITGILRSEDKKGVYYFPVYELEYKGKRRRVVRSFAGDSDKSRIGQVDVLHIDPLTSDFAEKRKGLYQLFVSISLTLCAACLMLAWYLSVNPFVF